MVPCIGRQMLNHWTTREVPISRIVNGVSTFPPPQYDICIQLFSSGEDLIHEKATTASVVSRCKTALPTPWVAASLKAESVLLNCKPLACNEYMGPVRGPMELWPP